MRYIIYPYRMGSRSARTLARAFNTLMVHPNGRYRPRYRDIIINWGNGQRPNWYGGRYSRLLNRPENIRNASNKLRAFQLLERAGISVPRFTTNRLTARGYGRIVCRHTLTGQGGSGIEIVTNPLIVPHAPLYTELIPNFGEYRVHVFNGEVIHYSKKLRERGSIATREQELIRNFDNGWIFATGGIRRLRRIESLAINAIEVLGLDFGSVDIIMDRTGEVYVLEVNTATGIQGSTIDSYLNAIRRL